MASIRQLAQRLDVSIGTVSRALNDRPGVHPETRAMVLRAATEIGYVANASGRSLRSGVTDTVGLVVETDTPAALGGDNFFLALADAMQGVMSERGYDLVLLPCQRGGDPAGFLRRVVRRGIVDAVVISATRRHDPRIELLLDAGLPFVTLGRSKTPGAYSWVDLDFEGIARDSVQRLAALGHGQIAVVVPDGDVNLADLYRGAALAALRAAGLEGPALAVEASEAGGMAAARALLASGTPPTAIMTCAEPIVPGLYAGLAEAGLRPGADVSVVGFREATQLRHLVPPPSSFALDIGSLGAAVARIITDIAARRGAPAAAPEGLVWPMAFRGTASVAPPPAT